MDVAAGSGAEPLVEIARGTLQDLRRHEIDRFRITLDSTLDHDLGLDSLARVELFTRIEREFGVRLPDSLFETAQTLRDIATALGAPAAAAPKSPPRTPLHRPHGLAAAPPAHVTTLDHVLAWHREHQPDFPQITLCDEGSGEVITYEQLWKGAQLIAGGLQRLGVHGADTIALMLPTSSDYFYAFFGVLLAGAVPVPLYPPTRASQMEEHIQRHAAILANAGAALLITTQPLRRLANVLRIHATALRRITTNEELRALDATPVAMSMDAGSTALLQYTSGSTGQPKGVVLSHHNILTNIGALGAALDIRSEDVFVSWLPLYHDMGLIGAWLGTLYFGLPLVIMSPLSFLTRPLRWLQAMDRYRGTLSAAPNFAYELCLKRVSDAELAGLDLSSWRVAMNGAEAVLPQTLPRFYQRFAACGLRPGVMTPVYGLAECSVGLTVPPMERGPLIDEVERELLMREGVARPAGPDARNPLQFVCCGRPIAGHQVRIVDEAGRTLDERREGRLEFQGPSATRGYFRNPAATAKLMRDGWLDSGDRAYLAGGEVYVTGRIKDIIIRAGRHIYPEELETAAATVIGIRKGCVAVFGCLDAATGTERVVVLAETYIDAPAEFDSVRQAVTAAVVRLLGEPPDEVVLAAPHTVLKTSSGKIRRAATRELYESGRYRRAQGGSIWVQMLRLSAGAIRPACRRVMHRARTVAYGTWFWAVFGLIGGTIAPAVLLPLPSRIVWSISQRAARVFIHVAGLDFQIRGQEHLQGTRGIIVVNHSSYLDGLFLLAAVRQPSRFVAKRELAKVPVIGTFLRHLGAVFVERFDARASVEDAHRLAQIAAAGESCIWFPEGTFTRSPGLMPFHLGAFAAAVDAQLPVLPVALRGTRNLLREGQWLPRRAPVLMQIAQPIQPSGTQEAFRASALLRDAAREAIRELCGEPDPLT